MLRRGASRATRWSRRSTAATGWCCSATRSSSATARCATRSSLPSRCSRELAVRSARRRGGDRPRQPRPPLAARLARAPRREAAPPPPLGLEARVDWREREPLAAMAACARASARARAYPGVWLRDDVYAIARPLRRPAHDGADDRAARRRADRRGVTPQRDGAAGARRGLRGGARRRCTRGSTPSRRRGAGHEHGGGGLAGRARGARLQGARAPADVSATPGVAVDLPRCGRGAQPRRVRAAPARCLVARSCAAPRCARLTRYSTGSASRARHVIFGHTHRAGPLPGDDPREWSAGGGAALINSGCWVYERVFLGDSPSESPYRPGFCAVFEDDGPPRLVNLLDPA